MSRNTVYRRIKELKNQDLIKEDFIENKVVNVLEHKKMGFDALLIGLIVSASDLDKANNFLRNINQIMFLFESYGDYGFFVVLLCNERKKEMVSDLRRGFEEKNIELKDLDLFPVSFEKLDLTLNLKDQLEC